MRKYLRLPIGYQKPLNRLSIYRDIDRDSYRDRNKTLTETNTKTETAILQSRIGLVKKEFVSSLFTLSNTFIRTSIPKALEGMRWGTVR